MGNITILNTTTKFPIALMGERAGVCWGADITNEAKTYKRGLDCIKSGHGRVMEFVNIEMIIDGYSARVIREYYTHVGGAPTRLQASTRYIDYEHGFDFVIPKSIEKSSAARVKYISLMRHIDHELGSLLDDYDIPKEDVAMGLPLGMTTKIVDKRNMRNLVDMSHQRMCNRAYWEYRELFRDILNALRDYSPEWKFLIDDLKLFQPKCEVFGYCPEKKGCGRKECKHI